MSSGGVIDINQVFAEKMLRSKLCTHLNFSRQCIDQEQSL